MKLTREHIRQIKDSARLYYVNDANDIEEDFLARCYIKATIGLLVKEGIIQNEQIEFVSRPICEPIDD